MMKPLIAICLLSMACAGWSQQPRITDAGRPVVDCHGTQNCPITRYQDDDFPEVASIKIVQIGNLKCADNQHIEGDGKSEAGNHCVDDAPKPVPCTGGAPSKSEPDRIPVTQQKFMQLSAQPKPLKCGKWEHMEYPSEWCGDSMPSTCFNPHCAPDMHSVTEKEWQELMNFLNQQLRENCRLSNRLEKKSTAPCDAKDAFK